MPRMQGYLPSELLQGAVRAELRRQALLEETDRYLGELIDEVGAPSPAAIAKATKLAQRIKNDTRATAADH